MARVLLRTQAWGVVLDDAGNALPNLSYVLKNTDGSAATHWSAETGGTSSTASLTTDANGGASLSGADRWVEAGEYDLTVNGVTYRVNTSSDFDLAVTKEAPLNVEWAAYGMAPGKTDAQNATALNAAIAALPASGGEIFFPRSYSTNGQVNLDDKIGVRLHGVGGPSGGAAAGSRLTYTGTASSFISARSVNGFDLVDMQVFYSNASFTGLLFDFSHSAGLGTDAQYIVFERAMLAGAGIRTAAILVSLDNMIIATFRDVAFINATTAVRGPSLTGHYANAVNFEGNCAFTNMLAAPILNPGQAWSIRGATFEGLVTSGGAQAGAGAISSSLGATGLEVTGCWFGDQNATGIWIDSPLTAATIRANYFSTGSKGINLQASSAGVEIAGNAFYSMSEGIAVGTGCSHMQLAPNFWDGTVTTPISFAALPTRSIYGNPTQPLQTSQLWTRDGVYTKTGNTTGLTSAQIDALFTETPVADGLILVDTTNHIHLQRDGGKWYKTAALTLIP